VTWTHLRDQLAVRGLVRGDGGGTAGAGDVSGVAHDSRIVTPGQVFVALKGAHTDGAAFVDDAIRRGAAIIVSEQPAPAGVGVAWTTVADARRALAVLAAAMAGAPSREMRVVGITGTNGKTTTAYLVASIFAAANIQCGIVGTIGNRIGSEVRASTHTTPEAPEIQRMLREMVTQGCGACAMEVSSHALAQQRVAETRFAAAIFTNLTRDHLDFHADMEDYFLAKRRLFEMLEAAAPAVINADDPKANALIEAGGRPVTYGLKRAADVTPAAVSMSLQGLEFDARTPRGPVHVKSALVGRPNVYNILAAVSAGMALDLPLEAIERGVASLAGVPGRFEVVSGPADRVTVVVDYAHTDDALRNLLETARPLARGRLITVFGCGGDRDRTKRPLMGAVAGRLSDVIFVTSDNPRGEDPARIIEDVLRGITSDTRRDPGQRLLSIVDRREAIGAAIEAARPGDLVLIAGKGHEKDQVIGTLTLPFDDVAVAREALDRRRSGSGVV
jgi:UDP-N-acetylmuramoyl-L-alanyl-D-glutamate--2,6-diaminopimelate ligase